MSTITIEQARLQLPQLIDQAHPGDKIVVTRDQQPIATLTIHTFATRTPRQSATLKGTVLYIAPDFAAPLEVFNEYMP